MCICKSPIESRLSALLAQLVSLVVSLAPRNGPAGRFASKVGHSRLESGYCHFDGFWPRDVTAASHKLDGHLTCRGTLTCTGSSPCSRSLKTPSTRSYAFKESSGKKVICGLGLVRGGTPRLKASPLVSGQCPNFR